MDLEVAVESVSTSGQPVECQREGLQTVRKLMGNILSSPHEVKFREVKRSNPAIQKRLFPACFDLLLAAGFQDSSDTLRFHGEPDAAFEQVLLVLDSLLLSLEHVAPASASSSSTAPARSTPSAQKAPAEVKQSSAKARQDRLRSDAAASQASSQEQLAALRQRRAGQYLQQQDVALAHHLSRADSGEPYDPIAALNASRGVAYSFVSCSRCGTSLRYSSSTRAQAVLCPCGMLLQPVHMRGQAFAPRAPSDLPVEPGEPVDRDSRPRASRGPFISVRGPDGETSRLPLHSVLQMVRQHEERQTQGAEESTIEALPTRKYEGGDHGAGQSDEQSKCQICLEVFVEGDELRTLPCFHIFHATCVDQWLKGNGICPTCRHKVG